MRRAEDVVSLERYINAPPATVFSFFSSGERWLLWQGVEATIELRPGGLLRINVSGDGFASGRILEVIPERRLVFTWGWESGQPPVPLGSSTVEIELAPEGAGTRLRLRHSGLPPEFVELHRQGWDLYVSRLAAVAG
jgi:uncharacterized protein YndB with AHSA1/START domain